MAIITLAQVKTYLGITTDTYDSDINAQLPIIDAKVKMICRNNFNKQIFCKTTDGSANVIVYGSDATLTYRRRPDPDLWLLLDQLMTGTQISGDNVPSGAYIEEVYYEGGLFETEYSPYFVLSDNATVTSNTAYLYAGINIAYLPVIAKGVAWLMEQASMSTPDNLWTSRSVGPLSVSKSNTDNRIEQRYGMPAWFVKALPRYHR
jgi:hypothetical protein